MWPQQVYFRMRFSVRHTEHPLLFVFACIRYVTRWHDATNNKKTIAPLKRNENKKKNQHTRCRDNILCSNLMELIIMMIRERMIDFCFDGIALQDVLTCHLTFRVCVVCGEFRLSALPSVCVLSMVDLLVWNVELFGGVVKISTFFCFVWFCVQVSYFYFGKGSKFCQYFCTYYSNIYLGEWRVIRRDICVKPNND